MPAISSTVYSPDSVETLRLVELVSGQFGRATADTAAGTGGGEAFEGAVDDGLAVELGGRP